MAQIKHQSIIGSYEGPDTQSKQVWRRHVNKTRNNQETEAATTILTRSGS